MDRFCMTRLLPEKLKWLKMKLIALHKSIDHLLDDRDQASMMKVSYCIVPWAYIRVRKNAAMSLVWDQYWNRSARPLSIFFHSFYFIIWCEIIIDSSSIDVLNISFENSGSTMISMRSLKHFCDFCTPPFQYQSPKRKELWLGQGENAGTVEWDGLVQPLIFIKSISNTLLSGSCKIDCCLVSYWWKRPNALHNDFNIYRGAGLPCEICGSNCCISVPTGGGRTGVG